ncbi:MAG: TetR/AcrR family transcriptional regulator [Lachnospiraceae bacterium]
MPKILGEEEKKSRERLIISQTMELYDTLSFSEITMNMIAQKCNMAKGTLFHYFPTKETLFAKILYREYAEWGIHELKGLSRHSAFTKSEYISFVLEQTKYLLEYRMKMIRLVSMKRSIINKNIAPEILAEEIQGLDQTIHKLSSITEAKIDFLTEEKIYNLYMVRHVILIGAYELATSPHNIQRLSEIHIKELAVIETEKIILNMTEEYLNLYCNEVQPQEFLR